MGLTDPPVAKNLTDVYPEGTPFHIEKAWVEGVVTTQFGDRTMAKVLVTPIGGGFLQEFAVWGSLCEQVQQVDEGDVPGDFKVVKEGKRWLFQDASEEAQKAATEASGLGAEPAGAEAAGEGAPAQS